MHRTVPGDEVRLGPPKGDLTLGAEPPETLRLVAWDTGWAAMKALLQELDGQVRRSPAHRARRVRLFLGADSLSGLHDTEYLAALEQRHPWLTVVPAAGGAPGEGTYDRLVHAVTRSTPLTEGRTLVAGPPDMVRTVTAGLVHAGHSADRIVHDPLPIGPPVLPRFTEGHGPAGTFMPPRRQDPA